MADAVRRPTDRANLSARVDHALTKAFTLEGNVSAGNACDIDNLGVGDFNLESRGVLQAH